jgi:hypothetical protein
VTYGSNHIRYLTSEVVLRLTTDAPITALLQETPFFLDEEITLLLGPDETVPAAVHEVGRRFEDETLAYWRRGAIAIPSNGGSDPRGHQPQAQCVRNTGAIIAAMTTSIPKRSIAGATGTTGRLAARCLFRGERTNRLSTTDDERHLRNINVAAAPDGGCSRLPHRQPSGAARRNRDDVERPSRHGAGAARPLAYLQVQRRPRPATAASHVFFDRRMNRPARRPVPPARAPGRNRASSPNEPDARLGELRGTSAFTPSSVMCWVACDRLPGSPRS